MSSILIQAWTVHKSGDEYYLTYTHWIYLKEIVKYYDNICLLSPIKIHKSLIKEEMVPINFFTNVTVKELPYSNSYISAVKYFFKYLSAYKNLNKFDVSYARYPIPFGWLQKIYMKKSKRITHFVGDPINTIKKNPNLDLEVLLIQNVNNKRDPIFSGGLSKIVNRILFMYYVLV